jgi:hypothetical protein
MVVFKTYTIELSVNLGKKAIYNCPIKLMKLNLKHFELDARQRASEAADRAKKNAEFRSFKASIKKGAQKPFLYTLNDGGDMFAVESRVQELLAALKSSFQASLRVTMIANFNAVNRLNEDIDLSTHSKDGLPASAAYKRAHSEAKNALNAKK